MDEVSPERYECVRRWLSNLVKDSTIRAYQRSLEDFCKFSGMNPPQIVELGRKNPEELHDQLKLYFKKLGLSSNTRMKRYYAIRSFCSANRVRLSKKPRAFKAVPEHEPRKIYEREDVAKVVEAAEGFRDKALITFMAQSGQRVGVCVNLRLGHLDLDKEPPLVVRVPALLEDNQGRNVNKNQRAYEFAIGSDSVEYLRLMLRERKKRGERVNENSPLFRSYAVKNLPGPPEKVDYSRPGIPLSVSAAGEIVREAADKAGVQEKHGKRYLFHPHGFRRFWKHQMRKGGVDPTLMKYMMGQDIPYSGAYDQWTEEDIRRNYARAEEYLRIRPDFSSEGLLNSELEGIGKLLREDSIRAERIARELGISPVRLRELARRLRSR